MSWSAALVRLRFAVSPNWRPEREDLNYWTSIVVSFIFWDDSLFWTKVDEMRRQSDCHNSSNRVLARLPLNLGFIV
jgi:hypothetical protein